MDKKIDNKYITVSDKFVKIYKFMNVVKVEEIKELSRKELMLMLILSVDSFSEDNVALIENLKSFKYELSIILSLQEDKECTDRDILDLASETDEKYIDTSKIRDINGNELSTPLTEEEALNLRRDISIGNIIK
jgi:hypothetical protein